ncbi:AfsR/SARP family transcriptional regulator [Streptomyces sp. SB3404]|uniref:AfsR/SARP family transcriptional regulator n=2 Tax=Streptomyces boncukensis TaxID=2711219 RepID=A0A6G4WZQ2_9ACTN|nr:AfsR/SARP family transcriptional regulator [Streptomyces boncukensis]NGO70352.1 AfsR/SARP family transcriptional regulator [Streptomyces boncukensis]
MDVGVLGALQVSVDGTSVVPTAPKPRALLALLAFNMDQVVPSRTICDELWGETPPKSAATTLQTYILQLRRTIAGELSPLAPDTARAKQLLTTRGKGYVLVGEGGECDVAEFDRLASAGMRRSEEGDSQAASELLRRATDLWYGEVLVDVETGPVLETEIMRLKERRRIVVESRVQIDLALGRHNSVVDELSALAVRDRTHEGLHGQLMLAQYRCGRRTHALQTFHRLRTSLLNELGLEPSPWLHRLQQMILDTDPVLASEEYRLVSC